MIKLVLISQISFQLRNFEKTSLNYANQFFSDTFKLKIGLIRKDAVFSVNVCFIYLQLIEKLVGCKLKANYLLIGPAPIGGVLSVGGLSKE